MQIHNLNFKRIQFLPDYFLSLFFNIFHLHFFILAFFKRRYFNSTSSSNLWTDVVHALAQFAVIDALHTAVELLNDGDKPDDASALVHLLRVSGNHDYVYLCRQLHGYILKHGVYLRIASFHSVISFRCMIFQKMFRRFL